MNKTRLFHRLAGLLVALGLALPSPAYSLRTTLEGTAQTGLEEALRSAAGLEEGSIRADDNDFFGVDRKRYLRHARRGPRLPKRLKGYAHSLPWPIDMAIPQARLCNFFGGQLLPDPRDSPGKHEAIDIQVKPGAEVTAIADGVVINVHTFTTPTLSGFADVFVHCPELGIVVSYVHLDSHTLPPDILASAQRFDPHGPQVTAGDPIGRVAEWHTADAVAEYIRLPRRVKEFYGRDYDHLHLGVFDTGHTVPSTIDDVYRAPCLNPLKLLRPLYRLPKSTTGLEEEALARAMTDAEVRAALARQGWAQVPGGFVAGLDAFGDAETLILQTGVQQPADLPPRVHVRVAEETTVGGMSRYFQGLRPAGRFYVALSAGHLAPTEAIAVVPASPLMAGSVLLKEGLKLSAPQLGAAFLISERTGMLYIIEVTEFTSPDWERPLLYIRAQA